MPPVNGLHSNVVFNEQRGHGIQTYSGRVFYPLDPRPEEIFLIDIAHALSMTCRFGGHTKKFYSVAEHSFHISYLVGPYDAPLDQAWGLLHDASEAYLLDLVQPMKRAIPEYSVYERVLSACIAERFDLPWPMPRLVKDVDLRMLWTEKAQLLNPCEIAWGVDGEPLKHLVLPCWLPEEAELQFLQRATVLGIS